MFSCSDQCKISIKQSFYFYNIQLVVKKFLRTSWTSSYLTGNSEKSAMFHSSFPLHHGKSLKCIYHLWGFFMFRIYLTFWYTQQKKNFIWIFLRGTVSVQTGEILLPVSIWPRKAKRKNGSKLGWDVITEVILRVFNRWRKIWHSLHLLFIIRKVRKHKTRYFSSNWRLKILILVSTSHYPTWTHSSFCAVTLNLVVKFRLFER